MKRVIRVIAVVMLFSLMTAFMSGCRMSHFDRSEIVEWAKENFDRPVVSRQHTERPNEEGYTDLVWEAYLKKYPELKFEIVSHKYYAGESINFSIESTCRSVFGEYYFEQYCSENVGDFAPSEEQSLYGRYRVTAMFDDRNGMESLMAQAAEINAAMEELGAYDCLDFEASYNDPLSPPDGTDVAERFTAESIEENRDKLTVELALNAADHRVDLDQFTAAELESIIAAEGRPFVIIRSDGSEVSYPDLILSRFGYGMSFGTLYEVLLREGFEPEGTPEAFSFTGTDGSIYEFSYRFSDQPYEVDFTDSGYIDGYYYLVDGERVSMQYYFYNHFRSPLLEEMTGMNFREIKE